jgi:integrase
MHRLEDGSQIYVTETEIHLSEPFQIDEEFVRDGIRHVIIGTKTEASKRRMPLPTLVLRDLPKKIAGPIFTGSAKNAGKRLNRFLRGLRISYDASSATGDKRKVVHSLRHRAIDRLRDLECPPDIIYQLAGQGEKTITRGYGYGYPVRVLKRWIDKIGY